MLEQFTHSITWAWPVFGGIWTLLVLVWILKVVIVAFGFGLWGWFYLCRRWPLLGWFTVGILRGLTSGRRR